MSMGTFVESQQKGITMLIYNGTVHTMSDPGTIERGYVLIESGKIAGVGDMTHCPTVAPEDKLDAQGGHIFPGLIDAHCHLGLFGDGLGFEGDDGNESTDPCTPHLRAIDGINPQDRGFEEGRQGGVTTVATGPGSANPIAGQFAVIKTNGKWIDKMVVKAPVSMKCAMGENPKWSYHERREAPVTRMAIASIIRENLVLAKEYLDKIDRSIQDEDEDRPDIDIKLEALLPVLRKEIPLHIHAHRADDILTGIRLAKEFDLNYVIVHGTEGHFVADILGELSCPVITGPSLGNRSKPELSHMTIENAAKLHQAGATVAICTDHPETPLQYLNLCASVAVKGGLSPEEALKAITITPAEILGIAHRVGSLSVGKDGDVVVSTHHPLDFMGKITAVFIDGVAVGENT